MSFKKFTLIFLSVISLFVSYNFIVWNFYTKKLFTVDDGFVTGDLVRMGYISDLSFKRKVEDNLPKRHLESNEYKHQQLDIITIGDSFSNGGGKGLNSYYQDYIATETNLNILNIQNYQEKTRSYIETAYILANSGFLKEKGVKYILIESVSRKAVERFSRSVNEKMTDSLDNISKFYKFNTFLEKKVDLPDVTFLNNGNFKVLSYGLLYPFSDNAFISKVYRVDTDKKFFSIGNKELLFYKNSLSSIKKNTINNLKVMNDNFNNLSKFLKSQGITLIYMPVVTKYDLYYDFILDKNYPKDPFFQIYKNLKKDYVYIDTKEILLKKIRSGEKDIYYVDDTHWTEKASEIVVSEINKKL